MRDTIDMAREAGFRVGPSRDGPDDVRGAGVNLKWFEALVRADERATPVQEPVARQYQGRDGVWKDFISEKHYKATLEDGSWPIRALYTTSPAAQRQWVGLTDEERNKIRFDHLDYDERARAIEAKLKEKNNG
jgi:hypothetical protein